MSIVASTFLLLWKWCYKHCCTSMFEALFWYLSRSGIAGSYGKSVFSFSEELTKLSHNVCTILHFQQQWTSVPVFPYPNQHLLVCVLIAIVSVKRHLTVVQVLLFSLATRNSQICYPSSLGANIFSFGPGGFLFSDSLLNIYQRFSARGDFHPQSSQLLATGDILGYHDWRRGSWHLVHRAQGCWQIFEQVLDSHLQQLGPNCQQCQGKKSWIITILS